MARAKPGRLVVTGDEEVIAGFRRLKSETADMTETYHRIVTRLIPGVAARTPHRTGRLASSYQAKASKASGRFFSPLKYAPVIEWGWPAHGIEGRHMAGDTIKGSTSEILEELEAAIAASADRIGFETERRP